MTQTRKCYKKLHVNYRYETFLKFKNIHIHRFQSSMTCWVAVTSKVLISLKVTYRQRTPGLNWTLPQFSVVTLEKVEWTIQLWHSVLIIQFDHAAQIHGLLLISMPKLVTVAENTKSREIQIFSGNQIQKSPNRRLSRPVVNPGTTGLSAKHVNQMSEQAVPLYWAGLPWQRRVISSVTITTV